MTSVLTVSASDPDDTDGSLLTYGIVPTSNQGSYFQIGTDTGVIYVARIPDRETVSSVDLVVVASDEDNNNVRNCRERESERGRERELGREGGREGEREGGRELGREGEREGE